MAEVVRAYSYLETRIGRQPIKVGSLTFATSVKVAGDVHRREVTIANAANSVVYNDELSSFNTVFIASDYNTSALIVDNAANSVRLSIRGTVNTNKYGAGLYLGNDTTTSGKRINKIQVFNTSGNTAKVLCLVIK